MLGCVGVGLTSEEEGVDVIVAVAVGVVVSPEAAVARLVGVVEGDAVTVAFDGGVGVNVEMIIPEGVSGLSGVPGPAFGV